MFKAYHSLSKRYKFFIDAAAVIVLLIMVFAAVFSYNNYFRHYTLTISGGEKSSHRHLLARMLQNEAEKEGITLIIRPTSGSFNALDKVERGELDLALVQGGLPSDYKNIRLLRNVMVEMLHLVVDKDIKSIDDLKGKRINMGSDNGGTQIIAKKVLQFFHMTNGVDYYEAEEKTEEIPDLNGSLVADAVFVLSAVPSPVVEHLVDKQGYKLLRIPSLNEMMAVYGWEKKEVIEEQSYGKRPPVPAQNIETLGVDLQLVGNANTSKVAVKKLLKVLDSPQMKKRFNEITRGE